MNSARQIPAKVEECLIGNGVLSAGSARSSSGCCRTALRCRADAEGRNPTSNRGGRRRKRRTICSVVLCSKRRHTPCKKTDARIKLARCGPGATPPPYPFTSPPCTPFHIFYFSLSYLLHIFSCSSILSNSTRIVPLCFQADVVGGD